MERAGWWHGGFNNDVQIVRSPQGDMQEMSYAQIIEAGEALMPTATADAQLGNPLEAATGTMCFAIPSGDRMTNCEMG